MADNRREYDRFLLPVGYTPISVRRADEDTFTLQGHAYNVSEGGVCFELDEPLEPGSQVGLMIMIPGQDQATSRRAAFALANIIWVGDVDDFGPVQHAAAFRCFCRIGDQEALGAALRSRRFSTAA